MEIVKGYGLPFPEEYSSCSNLQTKLFKWSNGDRGGTGDIEIYIDRSINSIGLGRPKHPLKFAWFCESRYICKDVYDDIRNNPDRFKSAYEKIFTCDSDLIGLDPDFFIFSPPGSNLPWVKPEEMQIFEKNKLCSMVASPKRSTYGHQKRLDVAFRLKDSLDLTGGAHGSINSGMGFGPNNTWWRSKLPALQNYMFHVVFENSEYDKYYTEKITDCFATGTVPIYWGTKKIIEDFNPAGIIFYDDSFNISSLNIELYRSMLPAIEDNFNRVKSMISADDQIFSKIKSFR